MSEEEKSTDGRTGMDAAKKFVAGDLSKSTDTDSYNGFGYGSSSLQNVTENSERKALDPKKDKNER